MQASQVHDLHLPDIIWIAAGLVGDEAVVPGLREALKGVLGVASVRIPLCWCKIELKEGGK